MKPKTILFTLISTLVLIILFNNKEEASFWLFGDIRTSKLLILGIFFLLGVITGGILFRRRKKQSNDNTVSSTIHDNDENNTLTQSSLYQLSDEDREFLDKE